MDMMPYLNTAYVGLIDGRNDATWRGFTIMLEPKDMKSYRAWREVCQSTLGEADVKLGGWIKSRPAAKDVRWADNQEKHRLFFRSLDDINQAEFTMKLLAA